MTTIDALARRVDVAVADLAVVASAPQLAGKSASRRASACSCARIRRLVDHASMIVARRRAERAIDDRAARGAGGDRGRSLRRAAAASAARRRRDRRPSSSRNRPGFAPTGRRRSSRSPRARVRCTISYAAWRGSPVRTSASSTASLKNRPPVRSRFAPHARADARPGPRRAGGARASMKSARIVASGRSRARPTSARCRARATAPRSRAPACA